MENKDWFKNRNDEAEKGKLKKISEETIKALENAPDPATLNIVDEKYGDYIKDRFPKTHDDTLRSDAAEQILTQGYQGLETASKLEAEGEKTQDEITKKSVEKYNLLIDTGKLLDKIRILRLQTELNSRINLSKSNQISPEEQKKEILAMIHSLENEVVQLQQTEKTVTDNSDMHEVYEELKKKYVTLYEAWFPEKPGAN